MATTSPRAGYARLIQSISAWAQAAPDVRGAVIIGSQARIDHPADEWSDLDVLVFVSQPERYAFSADWLTAIGAQVLTFVERTPGGDWERRVLFEGGLDVDFALSSVQSLEYVAGNPLPPDFADIVRRGTRILVDKDGLLAQAHRQPIPAIMTVPPPVEADFLNVVHDFWYHALWTARHLRRGEVWWAKSGCDMRLKELLRQMLEWHARATQGPAHDTWMRGRFLENWADPRAAADAARMETDLDAYFRRAQGKSWDAFKSVIGLRGLVAGARALPRMVSD